MNMLAIAPMDRWVELLEESSVVDEESEVEGGRTGFGCLLLKEEEGLEQRVRGRRRMGMAGSLEEGRGGD
jgi:hypothetical protein